MLSVIKENHEIQTKEVKRICLSWGNIPLRTVHGYNPNSVLFVCNKDVGEDGALAEIVIFNEFAALHPNDVRKTLTDWARSRTKTRLAIYTAIVAVIWVTVMTLIIYG